MRGMSIAQSNIDDVMSSHQESISTLLTHGVKINLHDTSKYVIHTSTIPISTNVDIRYLIDPENTGRECHTLFHGYTESSEELHCSKRSCMLMNRTNDRRNRETIFYNCPCRDVNTEISLKPLCFMMYVKSLNRNLAPMNMEEYHQPFRKPLIPEEIMFCHNSIGIFDNSYPGPLRDKIKVTGWNKVKTINVDIVLRHLWWYRKYAPTLNLSSDIIKLFTKVGDQRGRHIVMQSLHTINSVIVKKLTALGPELGTYRQIAESTAYAFKELIFDYSQNPQYDLLGNLLEPKGLYTDLKAFGNWIKTHFHMNEREMRLKVFNFESESKGFNKLLGLELKRLHKIVELEMLSSGNDYTLSPAFMFRMITLSQNRGMGYLPDALAECARKQYRDRVNRDVEKLPLERQKLLYAAMQKHLHKGGIIPNTLNSPNAVEQAKLITSFVEIPIKGTASVDTFVKDGGKLEDARRLLTTAQLEGWKIPIRNLETNDITGWLEVSKDDPEDPERILFWISYQLFLNHWYKDKPGKETWLHDFPNNPHKGRLMDARILHISEPNKERNLTKSHACLAWMLTPAAKILQGTLALLPEHVAGLTESGHDWRHLKRISSESEESWFLYGRGTGTTIPNFSQVFKDWTESTDFINKHVGFIHIKAIMDYIGFPEAYGAVVLQTIVEPQPVTEVLHFRTIGGVEEKSTILWNGHIREGFMMGNPVTKPILHAVHCTELEITTEFLRRRGIRLSRPEHRRLLNDPTRLDHKKCTENSTFSVNLQRSWR